MKKTFKRILIGLAIFLALIIATPIIGVVFFKGKILDKIKSEANKNLNAQVGFDNDLSLTLLRNFPHLSLGLNNIQVVGVDSFAGDTLAHIKNFNVTVDIKSIIGGGEIKVRNIYLGKANLNIITLESGRANWDIMKPDTSETEEPEDTSSSDFQIALQELKIEDANVVYDDRQLGVYTKLIDFDSELSGDMTADVTRLKSKNTIDELTFKFGGVPYLYKVETALEGEIDANIKDMKFTFSENKLRLNDLEMNYDGWFAMPTDDYSMDIKFATKQNSFKSILSLIPGAYTKDFKDVKTDGLIKLGATLKGTYSELNNTIPAFDFFLNIDKAMFQYPSLPQRVENIFVDFKASNPDGVLDHTVVNLSRFDFNMAGNPFAMKLLLKTPMSNPWMDMMAKGKLNLESIQKIMPMEGMKLSGNIAVDMAAKGSYKSIEKENYEAIDAKGNLTANNVLYQSDSLPYSVNLKALQLNFTPQKVDMPTCNVLLGKSDISLNGSLNNVFGYMFSDDVLVGNLKLNSNYFDANQFLTDDAATEEAPEAEDTAQMEVIEIPKNIQFSFDGNINKLIYDNLTLSNTNASLKVENSVLNIQNLSSQLLGGSLKMSGNYNTQNPKKPLIGFKMGLDKIAVKDAYKYFNTVKTFAPIAQYIEGTFNTEFEMNSPLGTDMMPVLNELTALGNIKLLNTRIAGVPALDKIATALQINQLKNLVLEDVKVFFEIRDGKLMTKEPYKVKAGKIAMEINGSTSLDQAIDYDIKMTLPQEYVAVAGAAMNKLLGEVGKNISAFKPGEKLDVNVKLGGTFTDPKVQTSLKDIAGNVVDDIKNTVKEKVKETVDDAKEKVDAQAQKLIDDASAKGDKLIAEAEKQATAIKNEAENAAKKIEQEAQAGAQKLMDEAGNNPIKKPIAQKAGDKLNKEAKIKADNLRNEARQKADKLISDAKQKKSDLIKEAENNKNKKLK